MRFGVQNQGRTWKKGTVRCQIGRSTNSDRPPDNIKRLCDTFCFNSVFISEFSHFLFILLISIYTN